MRRIGAGRALGAAGILLLGMVLGSLLVTPAQGHFRSSIGHIIKHARKVFVPLEGHLPPGATVTGVAGVRYDHTGFWEEVVSLPAPSRKALADEDVNFPDDEPDAIIAEKSDRCTGTRAHPTAPPGMVCIYAAGHSAAVMGLDGEPLNGARKRGFILQIYGEAGTKTVHATWAYTEPRG